MEHGQAVLVAWPSGGIPGGPDELRQVNLRAAQVQGRKRVERYLDEVAGQAFLCHDRLRAWVTRAQGAGSSETEAFGPEGAGGSRTVVLKVNAAAEAAAIRRDIGLLIKEEALRLSAEVIAAALEELFTCAKYKCF